ncbi:MAG: serine protein kinase RIO [Candidatus Aenigmarchaeota archaeon]|nr:serine protein kinase RIO [Candidatus Aenigmarchaeota archaeon]
MRKLRLEDIKEIKIERKVFDERTLFAIYKLITKGAIKSVESLVKEGKESLIFSAKDKQENWLALKIYRTLHCDFKSMWKYLIVDPRFSSIKKGRRSVVYNWCKREFKNLKIAFGVGVSCPLPIAFYENILVMKFIGKNGTPAPRLIDMSLRRGEAEYVYKFVLEEMKKLLEARLIHTDLSPYNILIWDKPYLIDFSQAVTLEHPFAKEFFSRDVKNINSFFKKFEVKIKELKIE